MSAPQQSVRPLPDTPSLNSLKSQAKQLFSRQRKGEAESCRRFMSSHPDWIDASETDVQAGKISLSDAQLVIDREYGFESWPKLKHHVEDAVPQVRGVLSEVPDRIVDEHRQSLERRHLPFAELLRRTLIFQGFSADTRVSIEVERSTYGSLIGSLPNPCCVYTFFADQEYYGKPNGNRGPVILDMTLPISGALLDGVDAGSDRVPSGSDDEARTLMTPIVTTILAHFERVWQIQPSFKVTDAASETDPGYIELVEHREKKQDRKLNVPDEEPVIIVKFDIRSDKVSGCIRVSYLNRTLQSIVLPRRFARGKAEHYATTLEGADRCRVKHLFEGHTRGRVEIDSVLDDQGYGMVVVDDVENPTVAQVTYYDECGTLSTNTWIGGDIDHPILAEWISHPPTGVVPESSEWEQCLIGHGGLASRRVPCVEFEAMHVDIDQLEEITSQVPEDVRIARVDVDLATRIQDGYWPSFANNFASLNDLVQRGIAVCALVGDEPALVALTNVVSASGVRLMYKENPVHGSERRALATAACAKLVALCLAEGREVGWWTVANAENHTPAQIGRKLGFVSREPYEMLVWE